MQKYLHCRSITGTTHITYYMQPQAPALKIATCVAKVEEQTMEEQQKKEEESSILQVNQQLEHMNNDRKEEAAEKVVTDTSASTGAR